MLNHNPINLSLISILNLSKALKLKGNNLEEITSEIQENRDDFTRGLEALMIENDKLSAIILNGDREEMLNQLVMVMTPLQNMKYEIEEELEYIDNIFREA